MNVPSTPTPSSTSGQTTTATPLPPPPLLQQTTKTDMSMPPSSSTAIQSIYAETFSVVGNEFLSVLVRELARCTQSQHVLIYQLMTRQDYNEMEKHNSCMTQLPPSSSMTHSTERSPIGSPHHQATSSSSNSSRGRPLSKSHSNDEEEVLMIRASHSTSPQFGQHAVLPLSAIEDTPFMNTILESTCSISNRALLDSPVFPMIDSFVGIRLHATSNTKEAYTLGMLCILDSKPMDPAMLQKAQHLLLAVQQRTSCELERVVHEECLVRAKNAAKMDAESKIKFLADMSHEIRTPMNAVIALTDLLLQERSSLNHEQTEHLEVIQTSGHHLLTVINDILDLSKINHDPKFKLEHRRFSLRKCVKDALNMARHQASMTQQGKVVSVFEYPQHVHDQLPLRQMISELERVNFLPTRKSHHSGKTRLPLLWRIDADVPDILMGDTMRLTQILLNLCSNAVKFTREGGIRVRIKRYVPTPFQTVPKEESVKTFKQRYDAKIETMWSRAMRRMNSDGKNGTQEVCSDDNDECTLEKAILEISVTDTGIGIPTDRLPQLFKSFSQIDISTARRYGGTGLGLAISSTLVNHMGGGLWVESEEQLGSCFALTLPLSIAPNDTIDDTVGAESASTNSVLTSPPSPVSTFSDGNVSVGSAADPTGSPLHQGDSQHQQQQQSITSPNYQSSPYSGTPVQASSSDTNEPDSSEYIPKFSQDDDINKDSMSTTITTTTTTATTPSPATTTNTTTATKSPMEFSRHARTPKQRYHHHKKTSNDENIAMMYPIKIMLAEDNVLNQKIAISILKRLGYHDVVVANNGREVLELMREIKFDVIFMDLYMPEMDGLEATRAIISERESGTRENDHAAPLMNVSEVYIIALTASASRQDRQICIDAGMNDFISKPFTMMEMKASLKNCVTKRKKRRKQQQDDEDRYHTMNEDDPMTGVARTGTLTDGDNSNASFSKSPEYFIF
ncbi:hypothetical protein K492DRAFT_158092 [Lichtheimia hyalospora FSU 10163]|nr:hypothetical protein K492DRAFT_158092 [Lichtheimia hyalospora FSU 10163]